MQHACIDLAQAVLLTKADHLSILHLDSRRPGNIKEERPRIELVWVGGILEPKEGEVA
jgi:hypothetical protein